MDSCFWRRRWCELVSDVFFYINNDAEDHPMPFLQRLNLTKYFLYVSAFVQKEIKKHSANPARESADIGMDFAAMWSSLMSEFLVDPTQPAFDGAIGEQIRLMEDLVSFTGILENFSRNKKSSTVNINFQIIDAGFNDAKRFIPPKQEKSAPTGLESRVDAWVSNPETRDLLREVVDKSIANGTFGTGQPLPGKKEDSDKKRY